MSRPTPVYNAVLSKDELKELLKLSEKQLVIIDYHQEWCGATTAISPFLNQLWIDVDDCAKRIYIATCSAATAGTEQLIQQWSPEIKIQQQGCKPLFVLLRQGQSVGAIDGVNTPALRMLIDLYLPKLTKKDEQ